MGAAGGGLGACGAQRGPGLGRGFAARPLPWQRPPPFPLNGPPRAQRARQRDPPPIKEWNSPRRMRAAPPPSQRRLGAFREARPPFCPRVAPSGTGQRHARRAGTGRASGTAGTPRREQTGRARPGGGGSGGVPEGPGLGAAARGPVRGLEAALRRGSGNGGTRGW